jgi:hypothetical protein
MVTLDFHLSRCGVQIESKKVKNKRKHLDVIDLIEEDDSCDTTQSRTSKKNKLDIVKSRSKALSMTVGTDKSLDKTTPNKAPNELLKKHIYNVSRSVQVQHVVNSRVDLADPPTQVALPESSDVPNSLRSLLNKHFSSACVLGNVEVRIESS